MPTPITPEEMTYDNSPHILAITGTFFAAAALVVLLRCYVRAVMLKVFGIDDAITCLAMVLNTATFVCFKLRTDYGLGRHTMVVYMDPVNFVKLSKTQYVQSIIYVIGLSTVKISIALTLLRLSFQQTYTRILWSAICFLTLMTLACAGTLIFQCLPVQAAWDLSLRPPPLGVGFAKCYSFNVFRNLGIMNSSFNIATDVLFACLPIPLIWQLQLNVRTKISLIVILSLGWFACGAGIIKIVKQFKLFGDPDWTVSDDFNVWGYIEFCIGLIAACLPMLKPLFKSILETTRAITSGARSRGGSYRVRESRVMSGYSKTNDPWSKEVELKSFTSNDGSSPPSPEGPYHVNITTQPEGLIDKRRWETHRRDSEDHVFPSQPHHTLGSNGIIRTREVSVV
jgi:hypothetical protein